MSSHSFAFALSSLFFLLAFLHASVRCYSVSDDTMIPMSCSSHNRTCDALLYHINTGLSEDQIASFYSVDSIRIKPIILAKRRQDYLISINCSCEAYKGLSAYFYDTTYVVRPGDTLDNISDIVYSGQAWMLDQPKIFPGTELQIKILCGCPESDSQIVVTYTVQNQDTLSEIATHLSAELSNVESMNSGLISNPSFLKSGWVLFVPMEKNLKQSQSPKAEKKHGWKIVVGVLASVTVISVTLLLIVLLRRRRKRSEQNIEENPETVPPLQRDARTVSKSLSGLRTFSLPRQYLNKENMEDFQAFESEKPMIFTIKEIEDATDNFNDTRRIGEGGYGVVYFGVMGGQEVAVKKMKATKSKEFFAELKVLCKIHHINVVELLGYSSGDDDLYLVYEYVRNGSLSAHLHDPLLKGYQPLSWTVRTQIALDAAKGIEYIHDHTKARYVHRDIKTTNILLDEGLRAKVADFGLAKLVGRTNDDDLIATRLVGTPGYLPPESVTELQVTSKTDVFAFGVVLAELITGKRALIRDNRDPNKTKSLITIINNIFQEEEPKLALEAVIDANLGGSYPFQDVYQMAEISVWCVSEDAVDRPEMSEVVILLSQIVTSSVEWESSLGGNSQVFSGVFSGR